MTAIRVIGWIHAGFAALGTALLLLGAILIGSLGDTSDFDPPGHTFTETRALLVTFFLILVAVFAAITVAIIVPLVRLKPGCTAAPIVLLVIEAVFVLLDIASAAGADSASSAVLPLIAMASSIAMIILLRLRATRDWFSSPPMLAVGAWGSTFPPAGPPPVAGQWAPDPAGRHQLRFYDGVRWTEWASSNGATFSDPIR